MSQNQAILDYLKAGNTLTGLDALRLFGTMKLASRISEIKDEIANEDFFIDEEMIKTPTGKRVMKYWISGRPKRTEHEQSRADNFHRHEEAINRQAFEKKGQYSFIGRKD